MTEYTVVVLGDAGVGKTTLTVGFVTCQVNADLDVTVDDSYRKQYVVDKEPCLLDILDTADSEHSALKDQYLRRAEGFMIVYAVTSRSSFESVAEIRGRMLALKMLDTVPMVVVGNKCDLADQRAVATSEGAGLAASFGPSCRFIETSAKSRSKVEESFAQLVRTVRQHNTPRPKPRPKCCLF